MKAKYELTQSEFHGGRHISYHRTLKGAYIARRRYTKDTDCVCGCAVIVYTDDSRNTGEEWHALQNEISYIESQS